MLCLNAIKTYTIRSKAHGKEQTNEVRKRRRITATAIQTAREQQE